MNARWPWLILTFLALLVALAAKGAMVQPPPVPSRAAAGEFDTDRARARLARVLGDERPHPVDSAAGDLVRDRLAAELRAMGRTPRVTESSVCANGGKTPRRAVSCATVRNLVVDFGPVSGPRLLLNSHYDSAPAGPGASDDGLGVATMLEVAHHLSATPPERPVTLLFNEGEEAGLLGARAFIDSDPRARDVVALLNMEGRGVTGPIYMFETSRPNGSAIRAYGEASRAPLANSLSADFYQLIGNDTDVSVLPAQRWTVLNFAVIGNETRYHGPGDNLAALDPASLHHMGSEVLALTRKLSTTGAPTPASGGRLAYTNAWGAFLSLPVGVALAAVGLFALSWVIALIARGARGLASLGWALASVAAGTAASFAALSLMGLLRSGPYWRSEPLIAWMGSYAIGLAAAILLLQLGWRSPLPVRRTGAWTLIALAGAGLSIAVPGASIFFLLAPFTALVAAAWRKTWLWWLAAALQLLTFLPLLHQVEQLLVDGPLWLGVPVMLLAALPLLSELPKSERREKIAVLALAAALWLAALLLPIGTIERPAAASLAHLTTGGRSWWTLATDRAPLRGALARAAPWKERAVDGPTLVWAAPAPAPDLSPPRLVRLGETPQGSGRTIRLRLESQGADQVFLRFADEGRILAMGKAGAPIPLPSTDLPTRLACHGRDCEGLLLDIRLRDRRPLAVDVVTVKQGLPAAAEPLLRARPATHQPQYAPDQRRVIERMTL